MYSFSFELNFLAYVHIALFHKYKGFARLRKWPSERDRSRTLVVGVEHFFLGGLKNTFIFSNETWVPRGCIFFMATRGIEHFWGLIEALNFSIGFRPLTSVCELSPNKLTKVFNHTRAIWPLLKSSSSIVVCQKMLTFNMFRYCYFEDDWSSSEFLFQIYLTPRLSLVVIL